jgi:hypothetical protein
VTVRYALQAPPVNSRALPAPSAQVRCRHNIYEGSPDLAGRMLPELAPEKLNIDLQNLRENLVYSYIIVESASGGAHAGLRSRDNPSESFRQTFLVARRNAALARRARRIGLSGMQRLVDPRPKHAVWAGQHTHANTHGECVEMNGAAWVFATRPATARRVDSHLAHGPTRQVQQPKTSHDGMVHALDVACQRRGASLPRLHDRLNRGLARRDVRPNRQRVRIQPPQLRGKSTRLTRRTVGWAIWLLSAQRFPPRYPSSPSARQ